MGRRRKDDDVAGILAQLVGLVFLVSLLSPGVRNTLSAIGSLAILLLVLAFICLVAFVIYRVATRPKRLQVASAGVGLARLAVSIPAAPSVQRTAEAPAYSLPPPAVWRLPPNSPLLTSKPVLPRATAPENLLDQLRSIDWFQFEKVVALLYRKQDYEVTRRGGANPDGGIDLLITKDGETKAVQCKQWKTWNVGVKAVREFLGALTDGGIQKGVFITLRGYTGEAKQLAEKHGIEIVNETQLAAMLDATDARFDPEVLEILQDTRKFCPKCEREMVLRTAKKGADRGSQFWGCSAYPRCRFTMPVAD